MRLENLALAWCITSHPIGELLRGNTALRFLTFGLVVPGTVLLQSGSAKE
jgi:hypothetical protein